MGSKMSETVLATGSRDASVSEGATHRPEGSADVGKGLASPTQAAEAVRRKACRERWLAFMRQIRKDYAYCTMFGVQVTEGVITACENIQRSLLFSGPEDRAGRGDPELFDAHWEALEALCARTWTGRLAELKFCDGLPISGRTTEGGRRFKSFSPQNIPGVRSRSRPPHAHA